MERQIKPLPKKPWEELTQKEQQVIRKSWKHRLPEEFDVFCIGDLTIDDLFAEFPGNLYVSGNACTSFMINVDEDFIVEGDVDTGNVDVGNDFIVNGNAETDDVIIYGDFIVEGNADTEKVYVNGDFIVHGNADTGNVDVDGGFIVHGDVNTLNVKINDDFIVNGDADTFTVNVGGLFDCYDVNAHEYPIHAADFVCRCYEEKNA